ncbi:MAG: LexA family transcriptional regulator [Polyangiaceae bacterium]|nr:LexA family transcriptional regulator [Polyangiaceae bacterium]
MPRRRAPHPLAAAIGRRIAELRTERGLTAERLAYESDFGSKGYLSDVERGLALPSVTKLAELASRLDVDLLDLLTFPDAGPRQKLVDCLRGLGAAELARLLELVGQRPGPRASEVARTLVRAFPSVDVAAGWRPSRRSVEDPPEAQVLLPVSSPAPQCFAVRACGTSMQAFPAEIRDGDWLLLKAVRVGPAAVAGSIALIARDSAPLDQSLHIKRVKARGGRIWLTSDDPEVEPMPVRPGDRVVGLLLRVFRPEELAPSPGTHLPGDGIASIFGLSREPAPPWTRVDGHLFLFAAGAGVGTRRAFAIPVRGRNPAETAFLLTRTRASAPWTYRGVARWAASRRAWTVD